MGRGQRTRVHQTASLQYNPGVYSAAFSPDGATIVTVLPITHNAPSDATAGVEIPAPVKRHLGLDDQRSWVMVNEGNRFQWPEYDLTMIPNSGRYDYGFLPPRFFNQILQAFIVYHRTGKGAMTPRE